VIEVLASPSYTKMRDEKSQISRYLVNGNQNVRKDTDLNVCSNLFHLLYFARSYFKPPLDYFWGPVNLLRNSPISDPKIHNVSLHLF